MSILVYPLFSGSGGNSTFVATKNTAVLVDAGVNAKRILNALLNAEATHNDIKGVLITHEHSDHIQGMGVLSRRYDIPIYANEATWQSIESRGKVGEIPLHNKIYIRSNSPFYIDDMCITPFHTHHDVAESVGYSIENEGKKAIVMTDTGQITDSMRSHIAGCDILMIESNHDEHMLRNGKYPVFLKRRILSRQGHLSNVLAAKTIAYAAKHNCRKFILAHLSDDNNTPEAAYDAAREALNEMGLIPNKDVILQIAQKENSNDPIVI